MVPRLVMEKSPFARKLTVLTTSPVLTPYSVGMCARKASIQSRAVRAFWDIGSRLNES